MKRIIKQKYLKNGQAAEYLRKFRQPAPYMLTAEGTRIKKYGESTIETFGEEGKGQDRKNYIETKLAKIASEYCGPIKNGLVVTGPNIGKHIEVYLHSDIIKTMHIPEINPYTYLKLHHSATQYPEFWNNDICLHCASAQSFKVDDCNLVDMDLMKTFSQIDRPVKSWLRFQSSSVDGKKAFAITAGIRKDGGPITRFNKLNKTFKILDAELESVDGVKGQFPFAKTHGKEIPHLKGGTARYCYEREFKFSNKGRIDRVVAYSYADGSPMLCVLILYK